MHEEVFHSAINDGPSEVFENEKREICEILGNNICLIKLFNIIVLSYVSNPILSQNIIFKGKPCFLSRLL